VLDGLLRGQHLDDRLKHSDDACAHDAPPLIDYFYCIPNI
jgi:hypothetical protein